MCKQPGPDINLIIIFGAFLMRFGYYMPAFLLVLRFVPLAE